MPESVETSTPLVAPVPPVEPTAAEQSESIAAHAEQFNPPKLERVPEPARERHRAQSQRATAADVPRINELTKKLREAEAEIARYKAVPARVEPSPPSVKPAASVVSPASTSATIAPSSGFTDPEPTLAQFADKDDPYLAYNRALAAWDRKKERFDERQTEQTTRASEAATQQIKEWETAHGTRMTAFKASHPDFDEKLAQASQEDADLPPVLYHAILRDDNGPEILYHLLTHPVELDDMRLRAVALPPTDSSVALLQRRLRPYAQQAATTGSAASVTQVLAPRPPNPVRTGPMHTGDEPRGEQGSIADHAKAFDPSRRR